MRRSSAGPAEAARRRGGRALTRPNRKREASAALLFVDLSKAFDLAVREILFGWAPSFTGDKTALMRQRGLNEENAKSMAGWIDDTGGILNDAGVPEVVRRLAASLHDGSWFDITSPAGHSTPIRTCRGGRQGCRLGAVVFNYIYAKALAQVKAQLLHEGVVFEALNS